MQDVRPKLYTVAEAAVALRVSSSHLYDQIEKGELPGVVRIGRVIRINLDVLVGNDGEATDGS